MAGIEIMGFCVVILDVHKVHKGRVCDRAMVAFQKVINDVLPVRLDLVGQAMCEFQRRYVGAVPFDVISKTARLGVQWGCVGIKVDEDKPCVIFQPHLFQRKFFRLKPFDPLLPHVIILA